MLSNKTNSFKVWRFSFMLLIVAILFVVSSLYFAPARLLSALLGLASNNRFLLSQTEGSFWHGSGEAWVVSKQGEERLGFISWSLDSSQWLQGKLSLVFLRLNNAAPANALLKSEAIISAKTASSINVTLSSIRWQIVDWPIPFTLIPEFLPADIRSSWRDLKINGQLKLLQIKGSSDFAGVISDVRGQISWKNAQIASFPVAPIGDYLLAINSNNKASGYDFMLTTDKGPLSINGKGGFTSKNFNAKLIMSPDKKMKTRLTPILSFFGKHIGGDQYEIKLGSLTQ